jgi:hypothetical protein
MKEHECHICGRETDLICEKCDRPYCEDCGAKYDQFTQIDYDCCFMCVNYMKSEESCNY